jgi:tetratricopeptide (TPR) repeat protein
LKSVFKMVLILTLAMMVMTPGYAAGPNWDALLSQSKDYLGEEKYQKALDIGEQALIMAEKLYGPEHINTAASLFNLAEIHRRSGNYYGSEPHYYAALRIRERILGREHTQVAACLYGLAEIMMARGEYQLAEKHAEQALAIFEKTNGPDNIETGNVYLLMTEISAGRLEFPEAESFGTKALDIIEKTAGPNSLSMGKALITMASVHIKQEKYAEASSLLQRADPIYMEIYDKKPLDTGRYLYYQAEILRLQGDPKKAQDLYKKARKYFEKQSNSNYFLGKTLIALAIYRKSELKYIKAEKLYEQGLNMLKGSLGTESIVLEDPIREMGELLIFNRNYQQAGSVMEQLVKMCESKYGTRDLKVANALNRLAGIYLKSKRFNETVTCCDQALIIADGSGEAGVAEKALSLLLKAKAQIKQDDYLSAQSDWEQASGLIRGLSEEEPLLAVELLATEALLNIARGNYLAAEPLLQNAIIEGEKAYGPFHPELAELLEELAVLYEKLGRIKEAEDLEKRAAKIYSKIS